MPSACPHTGLPSPHWAPVPTPGSWPPGLLSPHRAPVASLGSCPHTGLPSPRWAPGPPGSGPHTGLLAPRAPVPTPEAHLCTHCRALTLSWLLATRPPAEGQALVPEREEHRQDFLATSLQVNPPAHRLPCQTGNEPAQSTKGTPALSVPPGDLQARTPAPGHAQAPSPPSGPAA